MRGPVIAASGRLRRLRGTASIGPGTWTGQGGITGHADRSAARRKDGPMGMRLLTGIACWLLLAMAARAALPGAPPFRLLTTADGLPSSRVFSLARDPDGYLWIGSQDGLARYDGVGFRVWRQRADDPASLRGNNVQLVHVDPGGRLWLATESGGLSRYDPATDRFVRYDRARYPAITGTEVFAITSTVDALWFGVYGGGVYRLDRQDRLQAFHHRPGDRASLASEEVFTLEPDARGRVWVGTRAGLARIDGTQVVRVPLPGPDPWALVFSLTRDGDALWVGSLHGVYRLRADGRWDTPSWSGMFAVPNVMSALLRGSDGGLWMGGQRRLWHADTPAQTPAPVAFSRRVPEKPFAALLGMPDGGVWVGVPGVGLGYLPRSWRTLAEFAPGQAGLRADQYTAIAAANGGGFWLSGYTGVLERLDRNGMVVPRQVPALDDARIRSLAEATDGSLWLSSNTELYRIATDGRVRHWTAASARDPLPFGKVLWVRSDRTGGIWLGALGAGLQRRDGEGRVIEQAPPDSSAPASTDDIIDLEVDADGRPWVAGPDGVKWLPADGRWREVIGKPVGRVDAIGFGPDGRLWTHGEAGLSAWVLTGRGDWQRVARAGLREGLPTVDGMALAVDASDRVWLSTSRGMFRWDPVHRRLRRFGLADGLGSEEFLAMAMALSSDGVLAAGRQDGGIAVFDTRQAEPAPVASPLVLEALAVRRDGQWRRLPMTAAPARIAPGVSEVQVGVRLLSYADPAGNRYWTRLLGVEREWRPMAQGERILAGLAPGDYMLEIRASDAAGVAAVPLRLRFTLLPPWWQTLWARLGALLLGLAVFVAVALAWRQRMLQRHQWQLTEQARALAQGASEAKSRFLAHLGHEIRTPMTGVLGMSELLLAEPLPASQRGRVEAIHHAGHHLLRLVNDALDIARIEAGRLSLDPQDFDVRALADDVAALMRPLAERKRLAFRCELADGVPARLHGDVQRVRQIVLNLVGNAIKFTEHGEVRLVFAGALPTGLQLDVADTGPGLAEAQRARLFQRFEPGDVRRHGGSGLGLAISQELAVLMGGGIELLSPPGTGCRFRVTLPLPVAAAPMPQAEASATVSPLDLLLVEDDPTVADVLLGLLRAQGHRVVHAPNGLQALAALDQQAFDAGLFDLDLPGMDGIELARVLGHRGTGLALIAVTARSESDVEQRAREAGFDAFLRKPVSGGMLAAALADVTGSGG
jgi:signal transduction histidine kinase/CheY-like chemotaxis protein